MANKPGKTNPNLVLASLNMVAYNNKKKSAKDLC